jgi:hypothetical protein
MRSSYRFWSIVGSVETAIAHPSVVLTAPLCSSTTLNKHQVGTAKTKLQTMNLLDDTLQILRYEITVRPKWQRAELPNFHLGNLWFLSHEIMFVLCRR